MLRQMPGLLLIGVFTATSAHADNPKELPKLAVMPLVGARVDDSVVKILTDIITVEIGGSGLYQVISTEEVNAMLGMENMKAALGCDDVACAAEIGGALGVEFMVSGRVGRLGDTLNIKLTLFDSVNIKVIRRVRQRVQSDENLYEQAILAALSQLFERTFAQSAQITQQEEPPPTLEPTYPSQAELHPQAPPAAPPPPDDGLSCCCGTCCSSCCGGCCGGCCGWMFGGSGSSARHQRHESEHYAGVGGARPDWPAQLPTLRDVADEVVAVVPVRESQSVLVVGLAGLELWEAEAETGAALTAAMASAKSARVMDGSSTRARQVLAELSPGEGAMLDDAELLELGQRLSADLVLAYRVIHLASRTPVCVASPFQSDDAMCDDALMTEDERTMVGIHHRFIDVAAGSVQWGSFYENATFNEWHQPTTLAGARLDREQQIPPGASPSPDHDLAFFSPTPE